MTKISNETKIGVMAVVALAALILGFNFLKGSSLFQHTKKLYAVFDNVEGLEVSNNVQIDGLTIGSISSINESDKDLSSGIVALHRGRKPVDAAVLASVAKRRRASARKPAGSQAPDASLS